MRTLVPLGICSLLSFLGHESGDRCMTNSHIGRFDAVVDRVTK